MKRIVNHVRTDFVKVVFRDNTDCCVNLPHNIVNADYREDTIANWIDDTFKGVKRVEIGVPCDAESEILRIHILSEVHDAYDIFLHEIESVHDDIADWVDKWLERVHYVDAWYAEVKRTH